MEAPVGMNGLPVDLYKFRAVLKLCVRVTVMQVVCVIPGRQQGVCILAALVHVRVFVQTEPDCVMILHNCTSAVLH